MTEERADEKAAEKAPVEMPAGVAKRVNAYMALRSLDLTFEEIKWLVDSEYAWRLEVEKGTKE